MGNIIDFVGHNSGNNFATYRNIFPIFEFIIKNSNHLSNDERSNIIRGL